MCVCNTVCQAVCTHVFVCVKDEHLLSEGLFFLPACFCVHVRTYINVNIVCLCVWSTCHVCLCVCLYP